MIDADRDDPFLDQGLRIWIKKTAEKNFWRVCRWYDLDDLIQDGYMCYARTRTRYPDLIKPPLIYGQKARFVSMFKRIYLNEIHDLANDRTKSISEIGLLDIVSDEKPSEQQGDTDPLELNALAVPEECTFAVMLSQAPAVVKMFLMAMETEEGRQMMRGQLRKTSTHRETLNERLCKMIGCDPEAIDLEWEIRDAFTA